MVENLTKTKAKKLLFITFDKDNKSVLKEVKKQFSNVVLTKLTTDESNERYQLEFADPKSAKTAKNLISSKFDSKILKLESALQQKKKQNVIEQKQKLKEQKQGGKVFEVTLPKIILRNLSFKFNEELLKTEMEKYGNIKLVNLPKKEDGKLRGYAFVIFENMSEAKNAIEELNSRQEKLMGTKVVADWCLPKNVFLKNSQISQENKENNEEKDQEESMENEDESEQENSDNSELESADESQADLKSKSLSKKPTKFDLKAKQGTKDVQEKRTIFVRNLSYDCTEESVKETFLKFGPVKYVKLCWDKDLERPKGTAFIQFENSQSALDACAESDILEMDFRTLQVDLAVSRNQVNDLIEDKKSSINEPKDNRNLALAKEGVIYPNSYEAEGLSKSDLQKRQKLESINAEKLKLLHYFVSPTRLSVHNIPTKCSDQELREIFIKAIGEDLNNKKRKSAIVECRIMRDLTRVNAGGVCKSKGYGFVEFTNFEKAKKALHATNNNPELFPNATRLIVQFSIEDMRALKKKKERIEKSKLKNSKYEDKKTFDKNNQNPNQIEDDLDNLKKIKEKNLIKVHMLEKKLLKRQSDSSEKENKKYNNYNKKKLKKN